MSTVSRRTRPLQHMAVDRSLEHDKSRAVASHVHGSFERSVNRHSDSHEEAASVQ